MIVGHIGVRKGSKGVVGKNFRDFLGKPLIDWSLDQLLAHPRVDHVVVSTDDERIYDHAVAKGCLEMGLRPPELASDTSAKWDVWQHALGQVEELVGPVNAFLDLDCTSPLRLPEDIDGALDAFFDKKPDMTMSCTEARKDSYFNIVGRTVVITDSGGILGSTYVRRMLSAGAKVVATDLPRARAEALVEAHGDNSDFGFYELDLSNEAAVIGIFARVSGDGWQPNVALNNAAIKGEMLMGKGKSFPDFADTSVEDFEKTLRTNLTGAFMVARQMDRDIVGKYPATLINVASMYALNGAHDRIYDGMPFKNFSAYGVTKAGIRTSSRRVSQT